MGFVVQQPIKGVTGLPRVKTVLLTNWWVMDDNLLTQLNTKQRSHTKALIFFPFAGGGTVMYRKWLEKLSEDFHIMALNLPGRESRWGQPFITDYNALITDLSHEIALINDLPLTFFGHSFGGLTAYFTALTLIQNHGIQLNKLWISARVTPGNDDYKTISHLNNDEFIKILIERYDAIPPEILNHKEMLDLFIPIIKNDFKLYEQFSDIYNNFTNKIVSCDLSVICYDDDKSTTQGLEDWSEYSDGKFTLFQLPGDHMRITSTFSDIIKILKL